MIFFNPNQTAYYLFVPCFICESKSIPSFKFHVRTSVIMDYILIVAKEKMALEKEKGSQLDLV